MPGRVCHPHPLVRYRYDRCRRRPVRGHRALGADHVDRDYVRRHISRMLTIAERNRVQWRVPRAAGPRDPRTPRGPCTSAVLRTHHGPSSALSRAGNPAKLQSAFDDGEHPSTWGCGPGVGPVYLTHRPRSHLGHQPAPRGRLRPRMGTWDVTRPYGSSRPVSRYAWIGPFPLTSISPRSSNPYRPSNRSWVAAVTWMRPGRPFDSIRLAVLTVSPHRS